MQQSLLAQTRARLRQLGAGDTAHAWPTLVLAHATLNEDETEAIRLYEMAAGSFVRTREAEGEVVARQNLRILYRRRGANTDAARQVDLALAAAEASSQPFTIARASVLRAGHLMETGGDVGAAQRALLRAERLAFPNGPIGLRRSILFTLANAHLYLGQLDDAIDTLERHRGLRKEDGSIADAAAVAFNLLNARVTQAEARPSPAARVKLEALAREVVAETQRLARPSVEAQAHRLLGDLLKPTEPAFAAEHFSRCLEIEASLGHPDVRTSCLWSMSLLEASRQPRRAERLSREAISLASASRGGPLLAFAWQARLRLVWKTSAQEQAVAESLQALDAIERLRMAQKNESARAAVFSNWTRDYYWLAGRLLESDPPQMEKAFEVGERLRARVLLEHLARAGVPNAQEHSTASAREDVVRRVQETQRRLLSPALLTDERHSLLDQLRLLELERDELAATTSDTQVPGSLPFASLQSVQRALGDREALLWFSIAPWEDLYGDFGGGAWVLAITGDAVKAHRLSTRVELDSQVAALVGLLEGRDTTASTWTAASQHLGDTLMATALDALPPSIDRLAIISDGILHRLPFEALRRTGMTGTLGERFEIAVLPSATLFVRLRSTAAPPFTDAALVFADPDMAQDSLGDDLPLAPLPWARREAAAIARLVDLVDGSVHQGNAASEQRLKAASVRRYSVLHLAAHARADAAFPERSAVFLSPGSADEDGWLQPHEIAALGLRGSTVVLSACESAVGALVAGEGPLSLARAFFAGGATSVVATRWPLRDDDAAFVMERFYRALASGATVGAALRRARQDAITANLPAAAWAGIALLGDGTRAPFSSAARGDNGWSLMIAAAVLILVTGWHVARRARA